MFVVIVCVLVLILFSLWTVSKPVMISILILLWVLYKLHRINADRHRSGMLNLLKDGFILFDRKGNIEFVNMAAERFFGMESDEIKQLGISSVHRNMETVLLGAIQTGVPQSALVKINNLFLLIQVTTGRQSAYWESQNGFIMQIENITEYIPNHKLDGKYLSVVNEVVQSLIYQDHLTDTLNRRCFDEKMPEILQEALRINTQVCLLLLDIDHFKEINDKYGHPMGDTALKFVADRMRQNSRREDKVFRLGGDEFALALVNTPKETALFRAQQLCEDFGKDIIQDATGRKIKFTVSIGMAVFPKPAVTLDQLLRFSDKALYYAKAAGRNCVRIFDDLK